MSKNIGTHFKIFLKAFSEQKDKMAEYLRHGNYLCEFLLKRYGIRAIVSSRIKTIDSLKEKLYKLLDEKKINADDFSDKDEDKDANNKLLFNHPSLSDLCGLRIALYYPNQLDKIDEVIDELLEPAYELKKHPRSNQEITENYDTYEKKHGFKKVFLGYRAKHFRGKINFKKLIEIEIKSIKGIVERNSIKSPTDSIKYMGVLNVILNLLNKTEKNVNVYDEILNLLNETEKNVNCNISDSKFCDSLKRIRAIIDNPIKIKEFNVEVQVASILMHAWTEVEHELSYKIHSGSITDEEYQLLDNINGLVLSAEISLNLLEKNMLKRLNSGTNYINDEIELEFYIRKKLKRRNEYLKFENIQKLFFILKSLGCHSKVAIDGLINKISYSIIDIKNIDDLIIEKLSDEFGTSVEQIKTNLSWID